MQKILITSCLIVAAVVLSGCTLLSGSDSSDTETLPTPVQKNTTGTVQEQNTPDSNAGAQNPEAELPVALPDPVADQKAMQESQSDAPTGVSTQ